MTQLETTLRSWQLPLASDRSPVGSFQSVRTPSTDTWLVGAFVAALAAALAVGGYVAGEAWGDAGASLLQITPE